MAISGNAANALESVGVTYPQILHLKHSVSHDLMEFIMENVDRVVYHIKTNNLTFGQLVDWAVHSPEKVIDFLKANV